MDRRKFVKDGAVLSLLAGTRSGFARQPPRHPKPNVLYVFSDEHRACSLPGEPDNGAFAPNLAKFRAENLSLNNCISNYPVCSPYRGILLTGKWPYQTGIIDNDCQLADHAGSIGETFGQAGYETAYIGKWHLSRNDDIFIPQGAGRQGFQDWHVWTNTNPHFDQSFTFDPDTGQKIQPKGYNCTLMTDMAVSFLEARKDAPGRKPWMLVLSWNPPHPPFNDAPPDEMKRYRPAEMTLRPNVKLVSANATQLRSEQALRAAQQGYYAHISAVDREFARVLRALDESGEAENTIVVYTSDHGEMMGSHGYMGKRMPQEESCRVPFFIRYPGVTPTAANSDVLFSTIDIYPTLCGMAGVTVPSHCVGKDLSAAMRGQPVRAPESVFLMHIQKSNATGGNENAAPLFRGVRTRQYTYAIADNGRWCLYDNREDPYQQRNLIDDPIRKALMQDLDNVVLDWMKKSADPFPYQSLLKKRPTYGE